MYIRREMNWTYCAESVKNEVVSHRRLLLNSFQLPVHHLRSTTFNTISSKDINHSVLLGTFKPSLQPTEKRQHEDLVSEHVKQSCSRSSRMHQYNAENTRIVCHLLTHTHTHTHTHMHGSAHYLDLVQCQSNNNINTGWVRVFIRKKDTSNPYFLSWTSLRTESDQTGG